MSNPHAVTRELELAISQYTGAPYVVTVTSCTTALLLALAWHMRKIDGAGLDDGSGYIHCGRPNVEIPKRTYVSVPMSIIHAGGRPTFREENWSGSYQLKPFPVWDSARWFTSGMYSSGSFVCVSFHASKILGDTQGGAILHDNPEADAWFRRMRFDGRTEGVAPKDDHITDIGYHCYLSPDVSARLLWKLSVLPAHNDQLPCDDYPDLSQLKVFQ